VFVIIAAPLLELSAQQIQGAVSVSGGSATDVLGVTSRAFSVTPSLTIAPDARSAFALQASGTRFNNQQWSLTGGASAAFRAPIGRLFAATLNAGADVTTTSYEFSYHAGSLAPALDVYAGPLTVYGGVVGAVASMTASTTSPAQRVPGLFGDRTIPGQTSSTTTQRNAGSALFGAAVSLLQNDRVSLALSARSEPGIQRAIGSGVLSLALGAGAELDLSAGAYSDNRLVDTPAGRYVNVGVSMRTARDASSASHAPKTEGVATPVNGMTRLTLSAPDAARVEVAGDFSNWKPMTALRSANGVWYLDLRIPPGRYRYAFRVDGGSWTVPTGVPTVDDDFGGKSAWLVVSPAK
jgi:hypothetical protein